MEKEEVENGTALAPTPADPQGYVFPTKGDGTFYSIPLCGTNFFERWFTLTVTKPADTTVERVSLTLKDAAGTTLQTLLTDEAEGVNGPRGRIRICRSSAATRFTTRMCTSDWTTRN